MKQVFQTVALAVLAVVALLLVAGLVLPREWNVEKSVVIHAELDQVHPYVEDLREWSKWAHTEHPDPSVQVSFSGPERGVGATRHYEGERAGHGSTVLTRVDPLRGVWFESTVNSETPNAKGSVTYKQNAGSLTVTWKDQGSLPFITGGFMRDSVERGLEALIEQSLTRLKELAEGRTPNPKNKPLPPG